MKAKIPPDAVLLFCGMLMWAISKVFSQFAISFKYGSWLFWVLLLAGFLLTTAGNRSLARHKTTARPGRKALNSATKLVTTGIYQYSRNPVYLGMIILLFAWMVLLKNWLSLIGIILFTLFITVFQILPEEKVLAERFGTNYLKYKEKVRRWL